MVFRRPGRKPWTISIPTPGGTMRKSTGTTDKATARAIERALQDLATRRVWQLLNAVLENRLSVGELYDASRMQTLEQLRARLDDVDLEPQVAVWLERHGPAHLGGHDRALPARCTIATSGRPSVPAIPFHDRCAGWLARGVSSESEYPAQGARCDVELRQTPRADAGAHVQPDALDRSACGRRGTTPLSQRARHEAARELSA